MRINNRLTLAAGASGESAWLARTACWRCPLRLDVSPRCCVAAIPADSAAPRGHSPTLRLGGGGCREAESSEASRDFDVWGGWLEDRHDHGFLHGWARARRLRSWPN